jgi:hypothetical protein
LIRANLDSGKESYIDIGQENGSHWSGQTDNNIRVKPDLAHFNELHLGE